MAFDLSAGGNSKKRRGAAVSPTMNVTPLVDVVLVLLIIFMVVTPLLVKQMSVRVPEKPKDAAAAPSTEVPIVVVVKNDGEVQLNRSAIAVDALANQLSSLVAGRSDRIVFFSAEEQVTYGDAITVLDRAKSSGATVAVLTDAVHANVTK